MEDDKLMLSFLHRKEKTKKGRRNIPVQMEKIYEGSELESELEVVQEEPKKQGRKKSGPKPVENTEPIKEETEVDDDGSSS